MATSTGVTCADIGHGAALVLDIVVKSSDAFGPLKSAASGLQAIIDLIGVRSILLPHNYYQLISLWPRGSKTTRKTG